VRRADWLARPINPVLVAYAHRDAELTLLIYRWFMEEHPLVVRFHERVEFEPRPPAGTPRWLVEVISRPVQDPTAILMELGIDREAESTRLAHDVSVALARATAPRQINKLLRLTADLGLSEAVGDVSPFVASPSGMLRSTAARVIGQIGDGEDAAQLLRPLLDDPIEEVRRSAESAIRELESPKVAPHQDEPDQEHLGSLGDSALAALQQLRARMDSGE